MNYKDKRILVAGGTGLVGSNLVKRLASLGAEVRATVHNRKPATLSNDRIEHRWYDLTQPEDCQKAVEGMDYVFMCAAVIAGAGKIATTPLFNVNPNIILNCNMLEAAYNAGVKKYLTFGSSTAYPDTPYPLKEEEMFDSEPYDKYFFIGWVMRFKEKLCEMYSRVERPMPVIVLRPTNIYGPHDNYDLETSHVTPALIRKVVERHDPIEVWGRGEEIRDLLYVDDVVDAALLAMEKMDGYDPVNIGLGKGYSVKEILQTICEVENYHPRIVFDATKPTTIAERYLDISKAERVLSWEPKVDLMEGIEKTIRWYKEYYAK